MRARVFCLIIAAMLVGCADQGHKGSPVSQAWSGKPTRTQPKQATTEQAVTTVPASATTDETKSDPVVAIVNGVIITQSEMTSLLMESHGLRMLEEQILLLRAKQRAEELGVQVTTKDVDLAHERALENLQAPISGDPSEQLSRESAEQLLEEFLAAKNLSKQEWRTRMEQRAYLRAIAVKELAGREIPESHLRREFESVHGERVQIRHIQLSSVAAVDRARAALNERKDFELVARQFSENNITAGQGGLLPMFTRSDPGIAPSVRDAAFKMAIGVVSSAIREGDWYHLIRVEQRLPADGTEYEQADHDALRARIMERMVDSHARNLENELFDSAAVSIKDRKLKQQFDTKHRARKKAAG